MRRLYVPLCTIYLLSACTSDSTTESIVANFEEERAKVKSWEYRVIYKMKYFSDDEDTLKFDAQVQLIQDTSDTIFNGSLWIKHDSIDRYYDQEHIYMINHKEKKITKYFPHEGQDWAIRGNTVSGVIDSYYLNPNRLSRYLNDSTIEATLSDTLLNEETFKRISFHFPDELPIEQQFKDLYFNEQYELKQIIYSVKFQNEFQYNEWHFSEEKYNSLTTRDMQVEFESYINEGYTVEDYKEPTREETLPLADGEFAPSLGGELFENGDSVFLKDHIGKIVVLDFWYKDCFPCIKAIPSISAIRDKYTEKEVLVWGLNPFDNNEKDRKKLPEFMEINGMNYPIVFVDRELAKAYKVRGYPTFYILDRDGKVAYSKVGHSDESAHQIDSVLSILLH